MSKELLSGLVILILTVLLLAILLRGLKQPYFVAYILAGILLGPEGLGIIHKSIIIAQLGELGVIMLMFFIGAEINFSNLFKKIQKPLLGTLSQLLFSFICILTIGYFMGWSWSVIILLSFVISLSSSAIIFQHLSKSGEIHSKLGVLTTGVLILQDILIVPMMLIINFMAKGEVESKEIIKTILGGIFILFFLRAAISKKLFKMPFKNELSKDHDLQVFIGLLLCFGLAWVTHWIGLSPALGAFMAGIVVGQDTATQWLSQALIPFRVFFLTLFFLSVGLQIDLDFFMENVIVILLITFSVLIINSLINTMIFKGMGSTWKDSVFAGALLAQIGEFSFVLVNLAASVEMIGTYSYQITLAMIAMTMMVSAIWISIIEKSIYKIPKKSFLFQKNIKGAIKKNES
ncbi:cation:proton antiporter [Chondrinema litorale]|uniref:cation:proton antiporter n=1 Tax=Chondrinema litorale TaxID=2994555 RepID=UPI00254274C6|nr:cation:proton antiporter [Chondrinema litorale]UZR99024.1 cation:proton antiporter [Chondrinema litorale]